MAALRVSDEAGCHGAVGPPAPLQIAHGVLVQVACCHQRAARPQTSRRELQATLSCQETEQRNDAIRYKTGILSRWKVLFHFVNAVRVGLLRPTYHRGVTLRNTFNPMRGPSMSPAPNSTCRDKRTENGMKACSDVPKLLRKRKALFSHLNHLERDKFKVHLLKNAP